MQKDLFDIAFPGFGVSMPLYVDLLLSHSIFSFFVAFAIAENVHSDKLAVLTTLEGFTKICAVKCILRIQ